MAATFRERQWLEFCKEQGLPYTEDDLERAKQIEDENKKQLQERQRKRAERSAKIKQTHALHQKLIKLGADFIMKNPPTKGNMYCSKCNIIVTEITTFASEKPDVLGFANDTNTVMLEAKISRADFLKDSKKPFRKNPETGMGNFRLYITPVGLITPNELPENWGLIEVDKKDKCKIIEYAKRQTSNIENEFLVLKSVIRRNGKTSPGIIIKNYKTSKKLEGNKSDN